MKTPEELAEDFVIKRCNEKDDPIFWKGEMQVAFLIGYNAGVESSHAKIKKLEEEIMAKEKTILCHESELTMHIEINRDLKKLVQQLQEELKARDKTIEELQVELNAVASEHIAMSKEMP